MTFDSLLVGVDVGGTNTDAVLVNPSRLDHQNRGIVSFSKCTTTYDVSNGIEAAINNLFADDDLRSRVAAVTIGTTHFINAVIEQDRGRLEPVAVVRICGPYSRNIEPFSDFPIGLKNILHSHVAYVDGGHHVDGMEIKPLDEENILKQAHLISEKGIKNVAVVGIFAAMDKSHEDRAVELIKSVIPHGNVIASHNVSGIGFLERENATILNAAISSFAKKILKSFRTSIHRIGLKCPVLLTQNDGTVLTVSEAMETPIRTFSSGATNSMRGAAFLCSHDPDVVDKSVMIVDIGGTTADVGLLLPSGYPRQSSSHSEVGGVRVNFSMPHVESIGLGGGSIIREAEGKVTIGPDSVGNEIDTKALVFGGNVVTTTDVTLAMDKSINYSSKANIELVYDKFSSEFVDSYNVTLRQKLNKVIDRMKTSPDPIPVLLVGGGSFISPLELDTASKVIRTPYYQVANAIGAALGKLSYHKHTIEVLNSSQDSHEVIKRIKHEAIEAIVLKGALRDSVKVIEVVHDPVPYVNNTYTFEIKVTGDVDYSRITTAFDQEDESLDENLETEEIRKNANVTKLIDVDIDHSTYKPTVNENREWILSAVDLDYLRIGTYILGCGGGGNPYPAYLELMNHLAKGAVIKVISIEDIDKYSKKEGSFIPVAYAGSPTVNGEQLDGDELIQAADAVSKYLKKDFDGVISVEIGGSNGLKSLCCGSSLSLNLPVVDCDLMGRAYPTASQILPTVYSEELFLKTTAVSDGNSNNFLITNAQSDLYVEKMMRAALAEVGATVGVVHGPMTSDDIRSMSVHNSLSLSWRIGRAVKLGQQEHQISSLPERILECVGPNCGKKLFEGKIIEVEKKLFKGHVYGEIIIEADNGDQMNIPFKNENIVAKIKVKGSEDWQLACSVPDLISVCYEDSGEAVGTPEYKYGLLVFVLGFAPSDLWTATEKGIKIGGPKSFGPAFERVEWKPVGVHTRPQSVINEFGDKRN